MERMTAAELNASRSKGKRRDVEGPIQREICDYLDLILQPHVIYFSVPNEQFGGEAAARMGKRLNEQGRKAGAPDLILLDHNLTLGLEVKSDEGVHQPEQIAFGYSMIALEGTDYAVVRSVEDVRAALVASGISMRETRA